MWMGNTFFVMERKRIDRITTEGLLQQRKEKHQRFHRELEHSCKIPINKNKAHKDWSSTGFNWESHSGRTGRSLVTKVNQMALVSSDSLSYLNNEYPHLASKSYFSWDVLEDNDTLNVKVNHGTSTSQSMSLKVVARWCLEQKLTFPNWVKWGLENKEFMLEIIKPTWRQVPDTLVKSRRESQLEEK